MYANNGGRIMKIIIGISGATGVQLGYRMLQVLKEFQDVETHLVISEGAAAIFGCETDVTVAQTEALADYVYSNKDMGALISSGSFQTDGMIVIPCSMKTLSGIANAYNDDLIVRAADVCLKECRKVVIVPREMPLNKIHIQNMLNAVDAGYVIIPPVLTFYSKYNTVEAQADHIIGKILMQFGLIYDKMKPWKGVNNVY